VWRAAALKWCYTPTRVLSFCVISCGSALAYTAERRLGLALTARRGWWRAVALFTKATRSTEAELLVEQVVGLLVGETTGLHLALRHAVAGLDRRPVWRRTVRVSWRHDTLSVCLSALYIYTRGVGVGLRGGALTWRCELEDVTRFNGELYKRHN